MTAESLSLHLVAAWRRRVHGSWTALFPRCQESDCSTASRPWRSRLSFQGVRFAGSWYCTPDCLERGAARTFLRLNAAPPLRRNLTHRLPFGLLMLSRGLVNHEQLQVALAAQREAGQGRIGDWLVRLGFVEEQQVTRILAQQWSCPRMNILSSVPARILQMVPWTLVDCYRMLPVHYVERLRRLHIAFAGPPEYSALYAAEQMLDCHTEACVVSERELEAQLGRARQLPRPAEVSFETVTDGFEMARIVRSYVFRLAATEVRLASCGQHTWVRLQGTAGPTNLLFRSASRYQARGLPVAVPSGVHRPDGVKSGAGPADVISRRDDEQLPVQFASATELPGRSATPAGI